MNDFRLNNPEIRVRCRMTAGKITGLVFFEGTHSFRCVLLIPTSFCVHLRSPRTRDLNPCHFYPWWTLRNGVHVKDRHILLQWTRNIQTEIPSESYVY